MIAWTKGEAVKCAVCGLRKKPIGRDAPAAMGGGLCDHDCPGYRERPHPGDLWPGETREAFGYPKECPTCGKPVAGIPSPETLARVAEFLRAVPDAGEASIHAGARALLAELEGTP